MDAKKEKAVFKGGHVIATQVNGCCVGAKKDMKVRNRDICKLYPSASGNDYTSTMGGTKESSSPDTCKRQNFVCHEYFVPK